MRVSSKLLGKPLYATFDTKEQAQTYGHHLDTLLAQGIVPSALPEKNPIAQGAWLVSRCIAEYIRNNSVPARSAPTPSAPSRLAKPAAPCCSACCPSCTSAATLSRFLRNLANECERRYASQLRRHDAGQMNLYDPEQPWLCKPRGKNQPPS